MILGLGIDTCPVEKIAGILERQGDDFTNKVYTDVELQYSNKAIDTVMHERLSARWAVKEATIKALKAPAGLAYKDIETENDKYGAPHLNLFGVAKRVAEELGVTQTHISLSHAGGHAVAVVILEK